MPQRELLADFAPELRWAFRAAIVVPENYAARLDDGKCQRHFLGHSRQLVTSVTKDKTGRLAVRRRIPSTNVRENLLDFRFKRAVPIEEADCGIFIFRRKIDGDYFAAVRSVQSQVDSRAPFRGTEFDGSGRL